ncbi:hypothetical protein ERJ75_001090300 [Trypanosoma vivax]|nr:hypothetical protein ERJ75_001215300 [Trypanosoma vivax]KAH8610548.1 hypothetical protein ERJ75_001090300 [Trypanosoma vivax]
MPLSAARRWLKFLLRGCWAARLLECRSLPLLRRTRGLELLQSCGECFAAPLPLAVACLFALGGLAARTRDAPAGTHADDAVAEGPRPTVAIALPVHLRGRGRWEEAQMTEVAQATLLVCAVGAVARVLEHCQCGADSKVLRRVAALKELLLPHGWSCC